MAPTQEVIMKLIRQCCVCGTIMGTVGEGDTSVEKISHGYCSEPCAKFSAVQLMFWDEDKGAINMDQAYMVDNNFYWRGAQLKRYIDRIGPMAEAIHIEDNKYTEELILHTENQAHMYRVLKDEAKKWDIPVILR